MSQGKRESKAQADPLEVFSEALRERGGVPRGVARRRQSHDRTPAQGRQGG